MLDHSRAWDVLLIGGAAGTGKSRVSYLLAQRYGVAITEIDDFTTVLFQMTTPEQQPILHYWSTHPDAVHWHAEAIMELHLAVARLLSPAIEAVIARHLEEHIPVVLEGDYLLPSLAAQTEFAGVPAQGRVAAVFLYEAEERQLLRNFLDREPDEGEQDKRAAVSYLLGQWLQHEAQRYDLPALPARPWDTLLARIADASS